MDKTSNSFISNLKSRHIYLDQDHLSLYKIGHVSPFAVIEPETTLEMSTLIQECSKNKARLNIWGSGSHQKLGGLIQPYDIVLTTKNLNKIISFEPENLTITVESGLSLSEMQNVVRAHNLFLPINPPRSLSASIGGLVAANAFGSFAQCYGTFRDFVLGGKAILADGQYIKFGGKTVKNVAGYDLAKLFIGSMGTIGVITELTFKLWPVPEKILSVPVPVDSLASLKTVLSKIKHTALPVLSSVLHLDCENGTIQKPELNIDFQVRANDVKNYISEIKKIFERDLTTGENNFEKYMDQFERTETFFTCNDSGILLKWILPKSKIIQAISFIEEETEKFSRQIKILCYPGQGILYSRFTLNENYDMNNIVDQLTAWRLYAKNLGGYLIIEHAPVNLKDRIDVWDLDKNQLQWHKRIKNEYDPNGIFVSGRFVGGI